MASLLETIRQNSGSLAGQRQGVTDNTQQVANLLRAKSGKSVGGGDVGMSNLGEQQAVAQTNNQMQNVVAPQATAQQHATDIQAAGQEQQLQQQKSEVSQARKFDDIQTKMRTNSILQDLEQNKGRMAAQDEAAKLNTAAQSLRLQTQSYTQSLEQAGNLARLSDLGKFKEELARTEFGNNEELARAQLGNKSVLDASQREFDIAIGQMSAERAYDIFRNTQASEKERAMYTGVASVAGAGIAAANTPSSGPAGKAT